MPDWGWVLIAIGGAIVVIAVIAWIVMSARRRRTEALRSQFGPEYDRTVAQAGRRDAESELEMRRQRRDRLDIRPLSAASRARYADTWTSVQARFVDDPTGAVTDADRLVTQVMAERGYPIEDFEQRSADVSVDHPRVVESYTAAHAISMANTHGKATTEDLREAMVHYRSLFEELLGGEGEARAAR